MKENERLAKKMRNANFSLGNWNENNMGNAVTSYNLSSGNTKAEDYRHGNQATVNARLTNIKSFGDGQGQVQSEAKSKFTPF